MANRKLGRTTDVRLAMLKTQVTDLIWHEKIETTLDRAKELASENKLDKLLLSIDSVLSKYNAVKVTDAQTVRFLNGGGLALDRISIKDAQDSQKLRVYGTDGKFLGLGIVNVAKKEMSVYKSLYTK